MSCKCVRIEAARIILDLLPRASSSNGQAKLHWKPLLCRRAELRAIFVYKSINNLFSYASQFSFNRDFHDYNTQSRNNFRKTAA